MKKVFAAYILMALGLISTALGQDAGNERSADRTLRGSGRVNASTLGMEFSLPLGSYPGRGINVPISLSYSSKIWRLKYTGHGNTPGTSWSDCHAHYSAEYGERTASGWSTSMAAPYIEYVGVSDHYTGTGIPYNDLSVGCPTSQTPNESYPFYYVRRILVHLPGGETHEVRPDDMLIESPPAGSSGNSPGNPANWDATYFAADGSNLKYIQNAATNTYRIQMPDGSFYDLDPTTGHGGIRKATKYTDRNGNFTSYYGPGSVDSNGITHPNGYWKDTLGRNISIPLGLQAPGAPTTAGSPQIYSMPGMTGTYKLQWKRLNGGTQAESAMTDIGSSNYQLKYPGETYVCTNSSGFPSYCTRPAQDTLFRATGTDVILGVNLFNPVVLTEIELPTGQKYKFTYDNYGRIEQIIYPTGGKEKFTYLVVPNLSTLEPDSSLGQTNFGVTNRKVYESSSDPTPYEWTYSATYVEPGGYKVTINNPDGTRNERKLRRGNDACVGCEAGTFGYDNPLAGMAYEEVDYDDLNRVMSKKLTEWQTSNNQVYVVMGNPPNPYPAGNYAGWHPRIVREESQIFDSSGNGISSTTTFEYEGDLNLRDTPVLMKKSSQYAFVSVGSALPANPVRVSESTFLINDSVYASVKSHYVNQNMIGLVTASEVRDGGGIVVSKGETVYDETGYPIVSSGTAINWQNPNNLYRGNPTSAKVWDSTKGVVTNSSAYISTHAQFDNFGNQIKAWDAKGNFTTTAFDTNYFAFPVQVMSPIPSDGVHGSNSAFVTTATFDTMTGLPLTTTDANGLRTEIEYDPATLRPRFTRTFVGTTQVGSTAETTYHDEPNNYWVKNRSQIDLDKWAESITYFDGLGRAWKSEEINSNGNIFVEKEFDAEGRVKRVTNPFRENETKYWTTNVYDEASRVKQVTLQDGATVTTDYGVSTSSPIGVKKQITDQAGKKRTGITDALGNMVRVIEDPSGQNLITDYVFDTLGNLRKTTQDVQNRYFYHDSLGRLLRAKQPEQDVNGNLALPTADPVTGHNQWSVSYEYDDNGNITATTDARNQSVTATYDNLNRLKVRDYSDFAMQDVSFYYDGKYRDINGALQMATGSVNGKTTGVKSSVSQTNYTSFDNLGRLLTHQQITDGQIYATSYVYNLSGEIVSETYPSGRTVNYELNADGDLSRVWGQVGQTSRLHANAFKYDAAGNVEQMRLGNGKWETAKFNNRLQIKEIGLGNSASNTGLLKLELGYGTNAQNNGSLREQKITVPGIANPFIQTYTYDDLNRLQSATETSNGTQTWKQTFLIDRYGNREFDPNPTNTTTLGNCTQAVCNPDINAQNDNRFSTGQGYGYDQNGNVTQDASGQRFGYDAENHQKEFFAIGNGTGVPDATYQYDGGGKRVKKISSTETTVFVYNATGQLVAEYSTQIASTPQVSYLTTDHLGSPRVITNEAGTVKDRKDYSAFGEESASAQRSSNGEYTPPDQLRKNYTGYEKDGESGLEFAQARYYNPIHGRYTSVDPLTASAVTKNPQTFNRYSYVINSPYKFTDPLGLIPSSTGACGQWCPGSGDYVDGSAFRGRDASFDWAEQQKTDVGIAHEVEHARRQDREKPYFVRDPDKGLQQTDQKLTAMFTDSGTVLGSSSPMFPSGFNHHRFSDGTLHTIHIYGNDAATSNAGVYIPKEFSDIKITSKDTVVATNPKTGEVILIAHVQVGTKAKRSNTNKTLDNNMKTVRENGTVYIGQIGGLGGAGAPKQNNRGRHSHLVLFPSESSRLEATRFKTNLMKKIPNTADYTPEVSRHLGDFRKLLK